jgi:penicillin amidase
VKIKRDGYGVPHVYADTVYGVFYGFGYAIARDRLFQMDMVRYTGQGRVAEVLGADWVEFDKKVRANYKPSSIREQLAALPEEDRAVFEGYAAGINAWLEEVRKQPKLVPMQYEEFGFEPETWDAFDVAMVFVGSMLNRFGDFNTELANLQIFMGLEAKHGGEKAMAIFDQLVPRVVKGAPTTIPEGEWPKGESACGAGSTQLASLVAPGVSPEAFAEGRPFSNVVILGKGKAREADAILMNGPQFGNYVPSYVYSIGLHGAGFDLVGNTPYGYPVILFGYNRDITWGSTWGAGDIIDVYMEELNPANPLEYRHENEWKEMEKRTETIRVKGGDPVEVDVFWTVHGPVLTVDTEKNVAFSKRRSWEGYELDTLIGWMNTCRAKNWEEWTEQAARSALNVNMYYADKEGNIGYAFTGKYPDRAEGHDNRLPVPGNGSMEWKGFLPFDWNPKVLNPKQGYIANWNNRPAYGGVLNPDMFWYSWSKADRVEVLMDYVEGRESLDAGELWGVIEHSSFYDVNADTFIPFIVKAGCMAEDGKVKEAARALEAWDRTSRDRDGDGRYDELGTALFRTFLPLVVEEVLADDLGEVFPFFAGGGYPTPEKPMTSGLNLGVGTKTVAECLLDPQGQAYDLLNGKKPEEAVLAALQATVKALEEAHGKEMAAWRIPAAPVAFITKNFMAVPQAAEAEAEALTPAMNRGTENNMTVFRKGRPIGWEVTPPGQSGFVGPDGNPDPHYKDQLGMYETFGKKRTWLFPEDVDANKADEVTLTYGE